MATTGLLTVCTHNRTRSVLMAALLGQRLREAGCRPQIATGGFSATGEPATEPTIRLLAARGVDVGLHRSCVIDEPLVAAADLILCAERSHVLAVAGRYPGSFERTFTMPEFAWLGERTAPMQGDLHGFLDRVAQQRPNGLDYLDVDPANVGEIRDPTGFPPAVWTEVVRHIDDLAVRIARIMAL